MPDYIWEIVCRHLDDGEYKFPEGVLIVRNGYVSWIMAEKLKPCPFCGGEVDLFKGVDGSWSTWIIECDCGIEMRFLSKEEAIEAWNTRAERTCRNVAEQGVLFECSECGAKTVDAVGNYTQEYCAACGRRVQDAD